VLGHRKKTCTTGKETKMQATFDYKLNEITKKLHKARFTIEEIRYF